MVHLREQSLERSADAEVFSKALSEDRVMRGLTAPCPFRSASLKTIFLRRVPIGATRWARAEDYDSSRYG